MTQLLKAIILAAVLLTLACGTLPQNCSDQDGYVEENSDQTPMISPSTKETNHNGVSNFCSFKGCTKPLSDGCSGTIKPLCEAKSVSEVVNALPALGFDLKYVSIQLGCGSTSAIPNHTYKIQANSSFSSVQVFFSEKTGVVGYGSVVDFWDPTCGYSHLYGRVPPEVCDCQ